MIVEKRETTATWASSSTTVTDADKFAIQNWRHDVVGILSSSGERIQHARFDPNGVAFGIPRTDVNHDGIVDGTDFGIINTSAGGAYDRRADVTLDRSVDATDQARYTSDATTSLGRGRFSLAPDHAQAADTASRSPAERSTLKTTTSTTCATVRSARTSECGHGATRSDMSMGRTCMGM